MKKSGRPARYPKVKDVAEAFGVHERTIWEWTAKGILPHYRVGRSVFFKWSDIEAHMARNRFVGHQNLPEFYDPKANRNAADGQMNIPFHDEFTLGSLASGQSTE